MDDQIDLDLDLDQIEQSADNKLQVKNRFQQLANNNRTLAQEKEAEAKARAEAEAKVVQAEKEREFYKTFSKLSSAHPEATNYQDQILERVNKGYDPEEATLAVLAKEGKLGQVISPKAEAPVAEGGSAMTQLADGDKSLDDLSTQDKLSALQELEKTGELNQVLRAGINRS